MSRRVLVTATPATPNGDLHVGHLAGPYLAADAFRRHRKAQGDDVAFVTSTDDHQTYLERKAEVLGDTPEATAARFAADIRRTLRLADMDADAFTQPVTSPVHDAYIGSFFRSLHASGVVRPHDTPMLHCVACDRDLFDHDAQGTCSYCGEACDVGICEECGRPSSALLLRSPRCTRCGATPEVRTVTRLCIDLEEQRAALEDYHSSPRSRPHTRALWTAMAADRLPLAPVSNPGTWGVRCDVAGFEHHCWWGMAEMGPGYVATSQSLAEDRGWSWDADAGARVVQFFGYDNSYWQTVLHPALFLASGLPPAEYFVVNEFYLLDGQKFSSSKNHAVWGPDILGAVPADVLRYYVCLTNPEEEQTDFTLSAFAATVNDELAGSVERALRTLTEHAAATTGARGSSTLTARARAVAATIADALEPSTFSLRAVARSWRDGVLDVASHCTDSNPADAAAAVSILAAAAEPMMPSFAARWAATGGQSSEPWFAPVDVNKLEKAPTATSP